MREFIQSLGRGESDAWVTLAFIVALLGIGVVVPVATIFL